MKHRISIIGQVLKSSLVLKAATFSFLTSHTALTEHVPQETFQCSKHGQSGGSSLGDVGSQKPLHSQDRFTRNSTGNTTGSRSSEMAARSTQGKTWSCSLPYQDRLCRSRGPGRWAISCSWWIINHHGIPQAVPIFTYNKMSRQFSHRKSSTKETSTDYKLIML